MRSGRLRPVRLVGSARERFGARRGYSAWAAMPGRPTADSAWWAGDPHWFPAGTPPRQDTKVDLLIDGEATFRAVWQDIQQAQHAVWLVDWAMSVDMELVRGADRETVPPASGAQGAGYRVFDLLTAAANRVDVRVLLWSGSRLFRPRAAVAKRGLHQLRKANPRIRGRQDKHNRFTHCHHQKTFIIDGAIAYVGGLDMADFDVDRWDTRAHAMREGLNWHDLCLRLEGEAAADVCRNFLQRWQAVTGEELRLPEQTSGKAAVPDAGGDTGAAVGSTGVPVQVVRTIPAKNYSFAPEGEFGIAWAYQQGLRAARRYIYLENQYLWSPAVANELIAALGRVEDPAFRIALVLPARPNIGKSDTDVHVRQLREADGERGRVQVFSLYTSAHDPAKGWTYKPIYVHAKVAIVDDEWCTIGSANLNDRGMEGDSELNAQVLDAKLARELRLRLWSEHLGVPPDAIAALTPQEAIDTQLTPAAHQGRTIIDGRGGALEAMIVPYEYGAMPGDLSLGELEALLLDR